MCRYFVDPSQARTAFGEDVMQAQNPYRGAPILTTGLATYTYFFAGSGRMITIDSLSVT